MTRSDDARTQTPRRVADVMTREVATLGREDHLHIADDIMRLGRIRHMPVLGEAGDVVGMVSQRDLFRSALAAVMGLGRFAQRRLMKTLDVEEVMTRDVVTTTPDATLVEAAHLMLEHKIGSLPVLENGRLVGIVTEADFVALRAGDRSRASERG